MRFPCKGLVTLVLIISLQITLLKTVQAQKSRGDKPLKNIKALGKIDFEKEITLLNLALKEHHPNGNKTPELSADSLSQILRAANSLAELEQALVKNLFLHRWDGVEVIRSRKVMKNEKVFPITLSQVSEYLIVNQSGYPNLKSGDAIITINKRPIKDWIDQYLIKRYGGVYPIESYSAAVNSFYGWISTVIASDSLQLTALDFFSKEYKKLQLPAYDRNDWIDSIESLKKKSVILSSSNMETYSGKDLVYKNFNGEIELVFDIDDNTQYILDLREAVNLSNRVFQFWVNQINPEYFSKYSITYGLQNISENQKAEIDYQSENTKKIPVENIKMLIGKETGAMATLLAAICMDNNESCLVGEQTLAPYRGGYLPIYHEIKLFNEAILIKIPTAQVEYLEHKYPLRDRGLIPETIVLQTWEDTMLGEDTLLNSLFVE